MTLFSKTNLCVMSMELIFVLVFIKCINVPFYIGADWEFIGWSKLFQVLCSARNLIAIGCVIGAGWSESVYWLLRHEIKGSPSSISSRISNVKNKDVEYLSLLFTILTIVSFDFDNYRDITVFLIVFFLYCVLLTNTEWYATDPILRLRGLHLYSGDSKNLPKETMFLSFETIIPSSDEITRSYQKISETVYWLYPTSATNKN